MEASERLKREDCIRTKHDSDFSKWQILVGPSDWEDYCRGKEGATRYRIDNLPTSSGPGLYELGIAVLPDPGLGRKVGRKLDSSGVVAVYLGQAGNVRSRLQGYGRSGNHLGKSYSGGSSGHTHTNADEDVLPRKGSALFDEIFSRGYSIVYRWTSIESKSVAEKTEARLLDRFDYAWNKGRNGASRPNDVHQKLNKLDSTSVWFPNITRKMKIFSEKSVGVKIRASKPILLDSESSSQNDESKKFLPRVFKFMNSQPRLIFVKSCHVDDLRDSKVKLQLDPVSCGVTLDDGTSCTRPPVPGRVRCGDHKGRKKCESVSNSTTKGNSTTNLKSSYQHDAYIHSNTWSLEDENSTCGVELGNGKLCRNQPVASRKRCEEHKGLRVNNLLPKVATKGKPYVPEFERLLGFSASKDKKDDNSTCGVELGNGKLCRNQPVASRKRCEEHKGLRVNSLVPKVATKGKPYVPEFERLSGSSQHIECRPPVYSDFSNICGATTLEGNPCTRRPDIGSRRCWQHTECRPSVYSDFSGATTLKGNPCTRRPDIGSRQCWQHTECRLPVYSDFSNICGATTLKGNPCTRRPSIGSRRCWQH